MTSLFAWLRTLFGKRTTTPSRAAPNARVAAEPRVVADRGRDDLHAQSRPAAATPEFTLAAQRRALIEAFNSAQPVAGRHELWGRGSEVERLLDAVLGQRLHALVYGPRGSGKTSLVRVFGDYADEAHVIVLYESASASADFSALMRPFLAELAGRGPDIPDDFDARTLASRLAAANGRRVVMILDEFDRVTDAATRAEVANLLKFLSDMRADAQLVLVGVARNIGDLLDGHPSLRRHLIALALGALSDEGIEALIDDGMRRARMGLDEEARVMLRAVALGSPYHARLFCLRAGLSALKAGKAVIDSEAACAGFEDALAGWADLLNPELAATFAWAARSPRAGRYAAIAAQAALHRSVRFDTEGGGKSGTEPSFEAGLLEPLRNDLAEISPGEWAFLDPLAPQFLQASIMLARADGSAQPYIIVPRTERIA